MVFLDSSASKEKSIAQILMCNIGLYEESIDSDIFMIKEEISLEYSLLFKAMRSLFEQGNTMGTIEEKIINILSTQTQKDYVIDSLGIIRPKVIRPILNRKESLFKSKPSSHVNDILMLDYETQTSLAYAYNKLFDVEPSYYNHIVKFLPNIKISPILLEAFVYLKFIEIKHKHNQVECNKMYGYYKQHLIDCKLDQLIPNNVNPLVEPKEPFISIESQAGLLMTLLVVPNSCEDFTVTWDALKMLGLLSITNGIFNNKSLPDEQKRGMLKRILSDDFKASYYKICFAIFKGHLEAKLPPLREDYGYEYALKYANEFYNEHIKLASGVLKSKDWNVVEEIPDSWLALL